jgi:Ribonucleotide reductase, barrel domain
MQVWDAMCGALLSTGACRGAMMATLRCDHPDIEEFVRAKQQPGQLRRFNLSVRVTDAFMKAVRSDAEWPLVFPAATFEAEGETILREWPGQTGDVPCRILRRARARELWDLVLGGTYEYAEPGVLLIDRINHFNNLWYRERIVATNPCGEIPLPPDGACNLGSLNLTRFVLSPFTPAACIDFEGLADTARVAARMLDNVIDALRFPLHQQAENARGFAAHRAWRHGPCRCSGHARFRLWRRSVFGHRLRHHAPHLSCGLRPLGQKIEAIERRGIVPVRRSLVRRCIAIGMMERRIGHFCSWLLRITPSKTGAV